MIEKDLLFDKRIIDRNLTKGYITKAELKKVLGAVVDSKDAGELSEVSVQAEEFDTSLVGGGNVRPEEEEDMEGVIDV
jgi:hypothetical protein